MPSSHPMEKRYPGEADLEQILRDFGMRGGCRIERDLNGVFNTNLLVDTQAGKYVVRVLSDYASARHLQFEDEIARRLRGHGVETVVMKRAVSGLPYTRWNGRKVQVSRYRHGQTFGADPQQIRWSGRTLRKFHNVLKDVHSGPRPKWSNYPSFHRMKRGLERLGQLENVTAEQFAVLQGLYDTISHAWRALDTHRFLRTILHCDWHPWNALYHHNGHVRVVLDFDFVQRGYRIYDVAYALWALFTNPHTADQVKTFMRGYGKLHYDERDALPLAMARAALFNITTTSLLTTPEVAFAMGYEKQVSAIYWFLCDEGRNRIRDWCTV